MTDPNVEAARIVGRRAELGWFEIEFIMYGCAYLQQGKVHYKVSSQAEDIYQFAEKAAVEEIYTSNVLRHTEKCAVPSGMHDLIANDVKKDLARELQKKYSADFFKLLNGLAEQTQSNHAAVMLWDKAEQLEGVFSEEKLNAFEALVQYAYRHHGIYANTYQNIMYWIREERKNMDDVVVSKDFYEKTLYGFAYEKDGKIKYVDNALLAYVYEKAEQLELDGCLTTPILSHTYWHERPRRISEVVQDFRALLMQKYDAEYIEELRKIRNSEVNTHFEEYTNMLDNIKTTCGDTAWETALRYAYTWGILQLK